MGESTPPACLGGGAWRGTDGLPATPFFLPFLPASVIAYFLHAPYWLSLRGEKETTNSDTVTVSVPRQNQFTADALIRLMETVGNEGEL